MALPGEVAHLAQVFVASEDVENWPVHEVFDGIVWAVVAPPARNAFEIAALVEVALEELRAGARLRAQ